MKQDNQARISVRKVQSIDRSASGELLEICSLDQPPSDVDLAIRQASNESSGIGGEHVTADVALAPDGTSSSISLPDIPQSQLRSKNSWLSTALNCAADGIVITDPGGRVQFLNSAAQQLTGCLPEHVLGMHFARVFVFECKGATLKDDFLRLAALSEQPLSLGQGINLVSRDGRRCAVEAEISIGSKACGIFGTAVITLRDVTERNWEEQQRRQEHVINAVERLAETTVHSLNNLLTIILGNGDLLSGAPDLPSEQRRNVAEMIHAAEQATEVVGQLAAVSHKKFAIRQDLDLNSVIAECLPTLSASIPSRIVIATKLDPGIRKVSANRDQLVQILHNLLTNAVEATSGPGKILVSSRNIVLKESGGTERREIT